MDGAISLVCSLRFLDCGMSGAGKQTSLFRSCIASTALRSIGHIHQFAPLREGRRILLANDQILVGISIHAPARGATRGDNALFRKLVISIPAPARGATAMIDKKSIWILSNQLYFISYMEKEKRIPLNFHT